MTDAMPTATREVARRMNSLQQGGRPIDGLKHRFLSTPMLQQASDGITLRVCGQSMVGK